MRQVGAFDEPCKDKSQRHRDGNGHAGESQRRHHHAITVRIGEQQSVVVEIVRGELPGNSGPEAHPHDHRQESDDGQRGNPGDA